MAIATIEVDRSAILHNVDYFRQLAPNSELIAIVKANAYAHGKVGVAQLLADKVDGFGLARLSEAIELRDAKIKTPLVLLEGFFPHDDLNLLINHDIQTAIHCDEQIVRLNAIPKKNQLTVWFQLDTGMHRLGFRLEDAKANFTKLVNCQVVRKPINIISHFSSADELDSPQTATQLQRLDDFLASIDDKTLIGKCSIAAAGGAIAWPLSRKSTIRPGIALYGVSPFTNPMPELKAAMTFKSELTAIRPHKQGESVGYGQIWTSPRDTRLGVVAMGYGDGYPRAIPENTPVLINGRRVPIVGRVSMDMIVVDLGPDCQDQLGDDVIFWGKGLPVEEIANHTGISAYELLTRLTSRAQIHYVN
ncbi:alanine racemase [Orbaceae bacterium ESL0727]|nr:alanine racemase [Orbaceae bacterium ESL0727]